MSDLCGGTYYDPWSNVSPTDDSNVDTEVTSNGGGWWGYSPDLPPICPKAP
jgi:hypothetical protein